MGRWMNLNVDVLTEDVLEQFKDDELLDEIKARQIGPQRDLMEELRRADPADFLTIAERVLAPKWTSAAKCKDQYNLEMGR